MTTPRPLSDAEESLQHTVADSLAMCVPGPQDIVLCLWEPPFAVETRTSAPRGTADVIHGKADVGRGRTSIDNNDSDNDE